MKTHAGITFEWFAGLVEKRSRQTLTTMAKRVGLKPYRREGEWRFRNAQGDDVPLEEVFHAMQQNARGREWLRHAYEYPIRSEEEDRQRKQDREQQLIAEIRATFDFLITEFGYSQPFRIPVRIKDRLIVAYRNPDAGRQVEVSGDPEGYRTHCEIRRLIDGEPGEYGAHSIGISELRMVRERLDYDEPFDRAEAMRNNAQLLRSQPDVLLGEVWVDREEIGRAFLRRFGMPAPDPDFVTDLDVARGLAEFLVTDHGFVLEFDSTTLSPHEHEMGRRLLYRRGDTTVEIVNGDYRIYNEWSVRLNDAVIPSDWTNFEHDMAAALAEIARRLS